MNKKLIIFCLALAVAAMSVPARAESAYTTLIKSDNPLSFWEFEDSSGSNNSVCRDAMGVEPGWYKNTSTTLSDMSLVPGKLRLAAHFNGTSGSGKGNFVDINDNSYWHNSRLETSKSCTLELWVNAINMTNYPRLMQHAQGGNKNYDLAVTNDPNAQLIVNGCGSTWYTWPPGLFNGKWHYLVVSYAYDSDANQTTEKWYRDSILQQTQTIAGYNVAPDNWSDLLLGAEGNQNYVYNGYIGDLDEVAYYDYVLNQGQVTAHYFVPEPATIALLSLGGLALLRRKRA